MSFFSFAYRAELQDILALVVCLSALFWGAKPERVIALTWLILFEGLDALYHLVWGTNFQLETIDAFHASLDLAGFLIFLFVALSANRMYVLWVAAFQLLSATSHVARELADAISPVAYAVMAIGPSWGILLSLAAGVIAHRRRERVYGEYRDWRWSQSPASSPMIDDATARMGRG